MPRTLSGRGILSQIASSSKVKDGPSLDIERIKQTILGVGSRPLPQWAFSYSARRSFSCSTASKKVEDDAILRSASITLDSGSEESLHQHDDASFQILLEWRAMRSRLQVQQPDKPALLPPAAPLSPTFFDRNTTIEKSEGTMPVMQTKDTIKSRNAPLWISKIDYDSLSKVTQKCMYDIKSGERDLKKLASRFVYLVNEPNSIGSSREVCLEQARLYILAQWVARVDKALFDKVEKPTLMSICLEISSRLYRSALTKDATPNWTHAAEHASLRSVQQATLHRLFDTAYSSVSHKTAANQGLCTQALMLMNIILQDARLRPAQARHLSRKYLEKLNFFTVDQPTYRDNGHLWRSTAESVSHLISTGAIAASSTSTSVKEPILDILIRLMCFARSKRHISRVTAHKALIDLICKSQNVAAETLLSYHKTASTSFIDGLLAGLPFISTSALEEVTLLLHQSGDRKLLHEIIFMAPSKQRTIPILTTLMRNWSNVVPTSSTDSPLTRDKDAQILGHRKCVTSERVWTEALSILDKNDASYESKLYTMFGARMASHARSKAPSLVIADLRYLQNLHNDDLTREDVMLMLPEKGRIDAMRAFLRSGWLVKATKMAHELVRQMEEGEGSEFKIKVMNVLFSADIRLRMRSDVITSRRRCAVLLRRRSVLKSQRVYLRLAINRYFRNMKQATLKSSTTSSKKRLHRLCQSLQSMERFATKHHIRPNDQTTRIILHGLDKLGERMKTQKSSLIELLQATSIDWQRWTISDIVSRIRGPSRDEEQASARAKA